MNQSIATMKWAFVLTNILAVAACDDDVGYSANTTVNNEDTGNTSRDAEVGSTTPDTASPDTLDLPDTPDEPEDVRPDADEPVLSGTCSVTFGDGGGTWLECPIDVRDMNACDTLARCVCAASIEEGGRDWTVEACVQSLVYPRGSISLADYCALSGESPNYSMGSLLAELGRALEDGLLLPDPERAVSVEVSPECSEVAAFTLWGVEPFWALSVAREGMEIPGEWALEEVADSLMPEPLLTLEDIAWLSASEGLSG